MENSPKIGWKDRENGSTLWKFEISGFEIPNEFLRAVTESVEGTVEQFEITGIRDSGVDCVYLEMIQMR